MTQQQKLNLMKDRLICLEEKPKNIKCPGAVRKLKRQIRNLEKVING